MKIHYMPHSPNMIITHHLKQLWFPRYFCTPSCLDPHWPSGPLRSNHIIYWWKVIICRKVTMWWKVTINYKLYYCQISTPYYIAQEQQEEKRTITGPWKLFCINIILVIDIHKSEYYAEWEMSPPAGSCYAKWATAEARLLDHIYPPCAIQSASSSSWRFKGIHVVGPFWIVN